MKRIKQHSDSERKVNVITYHNSYLGIISPTRYQSYRVTNTSRGYVSLQVE